MGNITISVPITREQERFIKERVRSGVSANKAHAIRQALDKLSEEEAINAVLKAASEPTVRGDLRKLLEKY